MFSDSFRMACSCAISVGALRLSPAANPADIFHFSLLFRWPHSSIHSLQAPKAGFKAWKERFLQIVQSQNIICELCNFEFSLFVPFSFSFRRAFRLLVAARLCGRGPESPAGACRPAAHGGREAAAVAPVSRLAARPRGGLRPMDVPDSL